MKKIDDERNKERGREIARDMRDKALKEIDDSGDRIRELERQNRQMQKGKPATAPPPKPPAGP